MTARGLDALSEAASVDAALRQRLTSAGSVEAVVEVARAAGFDIEVADVIGKIDELSDAELEAVAGGGDVGSVPCQATYLSPLL